MKSKMKTTAVREIKGSFGRFAAILSIIALGVGFFSGVTITTPSMISTIGRYLNEHEFYDYRLVSTIGWDDEDVKTIAAEDDVRYAEGANSTDILFADSKDLDDKDTKEFVLKTHTLPEKVNGLELIRGRLPKRHGECVVDRMAGLKVGDKIYVSPDTPDGTKDMLGFTELRVVGTVNSSIYIHWERGSTSLGNGSLRGFAYVLPEDFKTDYYTDIYVRFDQDFDLYSDEYKDYMDKHKDLWTIIADEQAEIRYARIIDEGNEKLADGREQLDKAREEGEKKLDEAKEQLDDAKKTLDKSKEQLDEAKSQLDDAEKEIDDNSGKLDDAKKQLEDGEKQLADAKSQLDGARQQISDGGNQLDYSKAQLDNAQTQLDIGKQQLDAASEVLDTSKKQLDDAAKQLADGEQKLADGEKQIAAAEQEIADGEAQIKSGEEEIARNEKLISDAEQKLTETEQEYIARIYSTLDQVLWALNDEQKAELLAHSLATPEEVVEAMMGYMTAEQQSQLEQGKAQIESGKKQIADSKKKLADGKKEVEKNKKLIKEKKTELEKGKKEYQKGLDEYNKGLETYRKSVEEYNEGLSKYGEGMMQYNNGKAEYEAGLRKYNDGKELYEEKKKEFDEGKQQYEDGKKALEDGKKQYKDGKKQYEDGLEQYKDGLKKYEDGLKEYEDGKKELREKLADGEKELEDAQKKLDDLNEPTAYVLDRSTNLGYACFENDSEIVSQVARVFPIFFVLVAALVCMTTMSRMIEEQRTQIGMFKALGYSEKAIMGKYAFYSGSAALTGCIIGYVLGTIFFPKAIWMNYQLMYLPLPIDYKFHPSIAAVSVAVSLLCSIGITWLTCRRELNETAAELMRPKAPRAGKRVLLEYVPFIWKHMKFLHKVSVRNIFRYKKRLFMMIVGISGCTALLLTGFGVKDSVGGFGDVQFEEILVASADMHYKSRNGGMSDDLRERVERNCESVKQARYSSWKLIYGDDEKREKEMDIVAPENYDDMDKFFRFYSRAGDKLEPPAKDEAIVSYSLLDRYGVEVGDTITLRDNDLREIKLKVTGIFNNYIFNYVFINTDTITETLGDELEFNLAYMNFREGGDENESVADITQSTDVQAMTLYSSLKTRLSDTMASINYVVLLIIICAAGLAFVVIYNLTNINITERLREIATIKVLGFFRRETSAYVLRENLALTAMGIAAGMGLGVLLHQFVMAQIKVDQVTFKSAILPMSYVYSVVLTFVFNFIVNIFMEIKLDRINMAESLKSVD